MSKTKTSYYLNYGSLAKPQYVYVKTWKELKNLVKKSTDEINLLKFGTKHT